MPVDVQADVEAFRKQYDEEQAQQAQQEAQAKQPPSFLQRWTGQIGHVTTEALDSAVSEADAWGTAASRVGRDVAAGAVTGATNIADAAGSAISTSGREMAAEADPAHADDARAGVLPTSAVWDHARAHILDFRDAVAVKDPNMVDSLTQGVAQLAVPFAGYSRALAGLHGIANVAAAGAATDATALAPHDMRMADLFALGRHTEGKLGDALRALSPDGSALNAYMTYLGDRTNETEAAGRFKNVLDGFGVNMIATPLLHAAGVVLKQGTAGIRYAMENGVRNTVSDLLPKGPVAGSPAAQRGSVGVENNASGESAASLEAQNRPKRNLDFVDPDGKGSPILKDVTQVDQQAPKGHIVVDRDTGEIVSRGPDLNLAAARGLRARYEAKMFAEKE